VVTGQAGHAVDREPAVIFDGYLLTHYAISALICQGRWRSGIAEVA
jgi:hypothetical protein